jgi:molybdopterin molybdotransferase
LIGGAIVPDTRLDLDDAVGRILADTRPVTGVETIAVAAALGRVTAATVTAPINLPPFAASAMDGYALRADELLGDPPYRLTVGATSAAGHPASVGTPPGGCVRIFTGAALPPDLDTVVIQEACERQGNTVTLRKRVQRGDHVRPVGHDVAAGGIIIDAGRRLSPFDQGWLTACGLSQVDVLVRPRIGVFSTGDELLEPGTDQGPGQIYDANRMTLRALLASLPVEVHDFGIVPDEPSVIRQVLEQADARCDLVMTSGGVSVGEADWVRSVVESIGTLDIWKLNLKPGKPLAYGRLRHAVIFGLPGNPVSTIVTALMVARPVIERLCGATPTAPLAVTARLLVNVQHTAGREEFQRGTLRWDNGELTVTVTGDQSSNRLASFADANCLIRITKDQGDVNRGSRVTTLPLRGLL